MEGVQGRPVLIVDGNCALCNWAVRFVLKHERSPLLLFSASNSVYSAEVFRRFRIEGVSNESVILISEEKFYLRSAAVFRVLAALKLPYNLIGIFRFLPSVLTDFLYRIVSLNRKKWFGFSDFCAFDAGVDKQRFLD
jgi:predicted DCC family thiol-disulfide oxidoreductase YuxK